jgi:hypothetical protein
VAINPKKRWFDVPDSLTKEDLGNGKFREYYNVEARFADHPVLDMPASVKARHNVYRFSIVCEQRIKRAAIGAPAVKNMTPYVLRFDKGSGLPRQDFDAAKAVIQRCWEAWLHYQTYREAPITPDEARAVELINRGPAPDTVMVMTSAGLLPFKVDDGEVREDEDEDDEDAGDGAGDGDGSSGEQASAPSPIAPKPAKKAKAPAKPRGRKAA